MGAEQEAEDTQRLEMANPEEDTGTGSEQFGSDHVAETCGTQVALRSVNTYHPVSPFC